FTEGTFVLDDPDARLFNFLQKNKDVYDRPSTHYEGRSRKEHKGIDVFNGLMPAWKRTILFEQFETRDGNRMLFIKPENYSAKLTSTDAFWHGLELIAAKWRKFWYPGSDDAVDMRKERVPDDCLKAFNDVLKFLNKGVEM